jgi:hypothetical protein
MANPKDLLINRESYFEPTKNKRPYENTDTYENRMRPNRIDPRVFSVYKILEDPKEPIFPRVLYVDDDYVDFGYIEILFVEP